jgi:hypothetical protein
MVSGQFYLTLFDIMSTLACVMCETNSARLLKTASAHCDNLTGSRLATPTADDHMGTREERMVMYMPSDRDSFCFLLCFSRMPLSVSFALISRNLTTNRSSCRATKRI